MYVHVNILERHFLLSTIYYYFIIRYFFISKFNIYDVNIFYKEAGLLRQFYIMNIYNLFVGIEKQFVINGICCNVYALYLFFNYLQCSIHYNRNILSRFPHYPSFFSQYSIPLNATSHSQIFEIYDTGNYLRLQNRNCMLRFIYFDWF